MKKIAIMSMQRINNYGSFLQAYGLKNILENFDADVSFADYHVESPLIDSNEKKGIMRKISKIFEIFSQKGKFKHKLQYIKYKKNFGTRYFGLLGIGDYVYNPKVDILVIGSDEVFNCVQANSNVGYSLELFGKNNNAEKLLSYAGSFGNTTIDKINRYGKFEELKDCFSKFDGISVRDLNSFNIVKTLTGKEPSLNIDPVLLFDYKNSGLIPNINVNEKYLILYAYSGRISKEEAIQINLYAKKKNLKVYSIGGVQYKADCFIDASPFEVLAYFRSAEEIITDTFHGSIFSIINEKKFITLVRKSNGNSYGNEEKISFLLEQFGLEHRMVYDLIDIESKMSDIIDYKHINTILEEKRQEALNYLKENVK